MQKIKDEILRNQIEVIINSIKKDDIGSALFFLQKAKSRYDVKSKEYEFLLSIEDAISKNNYDFIV